jgi:hypothetical protein
MNKKNYDGLIKKYPKILAKAYPSCGEGWYWLLDNLCSQLQWDTDRNKAPQVVASQIKEKFGTLRFYTNGETDKQSGSIRLAETMSGSICEACGSFEGKTQGKGWIVTMCPPCYKKYLKERFEK